MRQDREDELDLAHIGGEADAATHAREQPIAIAPMRRAIEGAGIRLVFDQDGTAAGILRRNANPDLSRDPQS
jgi:hypothetical protein